MKMKWIAIGVLLALAGCASVTYIKDGASDEDYQRAIAGCRVQAAMVPNTGDGSTGDNLFHTAIVGQTIENCMRAQGWVTKR
jgi:uncharacterized protein YceK